MGAQLYFHTTAYTGDPNDALEAIQSEILDGLDIAKMVATHRESAQQAFNETPPDDEYGLHDHYKAELVLAKAIAVEELPADFSCRIDFVRRLHADTGCDCVIQ